jgi:ferredoxin-nitrite reductase
MSKSGAEYRLDGIYKQRQDGFYMQRVKLAAGVISAVQARTVAAVSDHFGKGTIHLTSRGSMEIHWLREESLPEVKRELSKVGLTSRGACGGAVRGITCGSQASQGFPVLESLARRLHRHFTGNPRFERLPKKFKIGIEVDVVGGRHLIQDVGLVLSRLDDGRASYDIWISGGLGREPQPGFLLTEQVSEERIIPIIEAVLNVYATHAPPPKRLKFLAKEFGEYKLRQLIESEAAYSEELPVTSGIPEYQVMSPAGYQRLLLPVFAGELTADQLSTIADCADAKADGVLMVTTDQDIALHLPSAADAGLVLDNLRQATGLIPQGPSPPLRVCPGNHECLMGLAATRDVAKELVHNITDSGAGLTLALAGCPNSCTQPQLADIGIISARLAADHDGQKTPRFDIYCRDGIGFGTKTHDHLTQSDLMTSVQQILADHHA